MKKFSFTVALILVLSVLSLVFVSCEATVDPPATYVITFDKQNGAGGSDSVTATVDAAMPTATVPVWTGHTFGGYFTEVDGGGTQYYTASMGSAKNWDKTSATTLYAKWTFNVYNGTSGGWVFYENPNYATDGWRFLEAAPSDIEAGTIFGNYRTTPDGTNELVGDTSTGIGTGQANTAALVAKMGNNTYNSGGLLTDNYAAKVCDLYEAGTYADWFLPSKDELNLMYTTLHNQTTPLGNFSGDSSYWSSSEINETFAWRQSFVDGVPSSDYRYGGGKARPVRAF